MEFEHINGIDICYDLYGSGEPLLLIGGFGMTREFWDLQIQDLKKHFKVIVFDNRGAGKSTVPVEPFTMSDMAADTIALMDALHVESAHVLGVSMGGMITQLLCLDHGERIRKAVLGCTSHGGKNAVQTGEKAGAALAQAANPDLTPEQAARMLIPFLFSRQFAEEQPERVETFIQLSVENCLSVEGAAGQMGALDSFDTEHRLREINAPVLILAGSGDRLVPTENSKQLLDHIPNAKLRIIPGAGHNFFYEKAPELNRILLDFFLGESTR
jgi:3-oxoadipate enol-lactonase